jgi:Ca2+-binding EF-hand superfamily protein
VLEKGASPPVGDEELRAAHAMIRDKVNARSREIRQSFRSMDEDHSGFLTKQEIKDGLAILGITSK